MNLQPPISLEGSRIYRDHDEFAANASNTSINSGDTTNNDHNNNINNDHNNRHNSHDDPSSPSSYSSNGSNNVLAISSNDLTPVSSDNSNTGAATTVTADALTQTTPKRSTSSSTSPARQYPKKRQSSSNRKRSKSRSENPSADVYSSSSVPSYSDSNISNLKSSSARKRKSRHLFSSKQFKIFRNLLLLEQNLRMQYAEQQSLRTKFVSFYFAMIASSSMIFLRLYFLSAYNNLKHTQSSSLANPSLIEDQNGSEEDYGKSWNLFLRFFLVFEIVTILLFHISGEYKRTIIMPKKFLYLTNKSLRQLNVRLIKLPKSVLDQLLDVLKVCFGAILWILIYVIECLLPFKDVIMEKNFCYLRSFLKVLKILKLRLVLLHLNSNYDQVNLNSTFNIKLSLNSRVFNPNIRESWELFRNEFWLKEFTRRTKLIYSINYDTDIVAIEKMVLNNESVNASNSSNSNRKPHNSPNVGSQSKSPTRTPMANRKPRKSTLTYSPSTPQSNNPAILTPLTTQMLKSFESENSNNINNSSSGVAGTTSAAATTNADNSYLQPQQSSPLLNKTELVSKDKNDRKVRRKSHILMNSASPNAEFLKELESPDDDNDEALEIDDERKNKFDDEHFSKVQDEIKKRSSSSKTRRRRNS